MSELELPQYGAAIDYDGGKPVLLFANDRGRSLAARPALEAAGVRLVATVALDAAVQRIDDQLALGLAWLELGEADSDAQLDVVLQRLDRLAEERDIPVIAAVPMALVDTVVARLSSPRVEILIDPDDAQRSAALAVALSGARREGAVRDVGTDNAARLRQLSDEMGRIATMLARLSTGPDGPAIKSGAAGVAAPPIDPEAVRAVIRARRLRSRFFADELFADPAWDMLLDLFQAEIAQLRVPVSSLCIAAAVPATTALRWIKTMTEQGLFLRRADPHDGRRVFVELAPAASDAMRRYFAEVGRMAVV